MYGAHTNAYGSKLDLEVKRSNVNVRPSFKRLCITKTRLFKYIETFTTKKMAIFQKKKSDIFQISAQNID